MFEKEAEEYSNNWKINKNNDLNFAELVELRAVIYKANKDGAEYGFQKGIKTKVNFTTISDCPVKDEWHYVSKEGFPSKDDIYLIIRNDGLHLGDYCCGGDGDIDCQSWCDYPSEEEIQDDSVIAWKEIVLPKEIE